MILKQIVKIRKEQKMNQHVLADTAGISRSALSGYELGYQSPNLDTTLDMLGILGYDLIIKKKEDTQ